MHLRARYFDPTLGSLLSRDPFVGSLDASGTRNGYSYVIGNPINRAVGEHRSVLKLIPRLICATPQALEVRVLTACTRTFCIQKERSISLLMLRSLPFLTKASRINVLLENRISTKNDAT